MSSSIINDEIDGVLSWDPRHLLLDLGANSWHDPKYKLGIAGYILLNKRALCIETADGFFIFNGKSSNITIFFYYVDVL